MFSFNINQNGFVFVYNLMRAYVISRNIISYKNCKFFTIKKMCTPTNQLSSSPSSRSSFRHKLLPLVSATKCQSGICCYRTVHWWGYLYKRWGHKPAQQPCLGWRKPAFNIFSKPPGTLQGERMGWNHRWYVGGSSLLATSLEWRKL